MLPFVNSPEDCRSWIIEVTIKSMLGKHFLKIFKQIGRRLVSTQSSIVKPTVTLWKDNLKYTTSPRDWVQWITSPKYAEILHIPPWLGNMTIKPYKQFDEIRMNTEKKCRKINS